MSKKFFNVVSCPKLDAEIEFSVKFEKKNFFWSDTKIARLVQSSQRIALVLADALVAKVNPDATRKKIFLVIVLVVGHGILVLFAIFSVEIIKGLVRYHYETTWAWIGHQKKRS